MEINKNMFEGLGQKEATNEELLELSVTLYNPIKEENICFDTPKIINGFFRIDNPLKWKDVKVIYKGIVYDIKDGESDKEYIYWNSKKPNELKDSHTGFRRIKKTKNIFPMMI